MSTTKLETPLTAEIDQVERWRLDELERAGYDHDSAVVLAASHDVDLHAAVDLLRSGCSVDLAVRILL